MPRRLRIAARAARDIDWIGIYSRRRWGTDVCVGSDSTAAFDSAKGSLTNVCVSTTVTDNLADAGASTCNN